MSSVVDRQKLLRVLDLQATQSKASPNPSAIVPSRSESKATPSQLESFWVKPVGYGWPTGSTLSPERLLHGAHCSGGRLAPTGERVTRQSRSLGARESR